MRASTDRPGSETHLPSKMTLRERVEQQPGFWLLSAILVGFMSGIGAYEAIVRIAQLQVISKAELEGLKRSAPGDSARQSAAWSGSWETDTDTYKNLRIRFIGSNGELVGTYRAPGQNSQLPTGRVEGRLKGNSLVGRWLELLSDREVGGEFSFVLLDDGRSFLGTYTRDWEGNRVKHVWTGKKIE